MRTYTLTVSLLFVLVFKVNASDFRVTQAIDTVEASNYFFIADSLHKASKFPEAIKYYDKAAVIFKEAKIWGRYFNAKNSAAVAIYLFGEYDESIRIVDEVIELSKTKYGSDNLYESRALNIKSLNHLEKGLYDEALVNIKSALEINSSHGEEGLVQLADVYYDISVIYVAIGDYATSLDYVHKALKVDKQLFGEKSSDVASEYGTLAHAYSKIGMYDSATYYYQKSANLWRELRGGKHFELARTYSNMAAVYNNYGAYDKAIELATRQLSIIKDILPDLHIGTSYAYANLGKSYREKGDYRMANNYVTKALNIRRAVLGEKHIRVAFLYAELGINAARQDSSQKALNYFDKAIDIIRNNYSPNHPYLANYYSHKAKIYRELNKYDLALDLHASAIDVFRNSKLDKDTELGSKFNELGETYLDMNVYDSARKYTKKAIRTNNLKLNAEEKFEIPPLKGVLNPNMYLHSLFQLATIEYESYQEDSGLKALKRSFGLINSSDQTVTTIRHNLIRQNDKIELNNISKQVYELGVRISGDLFNQTGEKQYMEKMHYFFERSKSIILQLHVSESVALKSDFIPENIKALESSYKAEKSFYQSLINQEKTNKGEKNVKLLEGFELKLFNLQQSHDSLIYVFKEYYPKYYSMRYSTDILTTEELQSQLTHDEALVEYFVGDSSIYALTITARDFHMIKFSTHTSLRDDVQNFRRLMSPGGHLGHSNDEYVRQANAFYENYVSKALEKLDLEVNKLIIITDGEIGYIPFEILLSDVPQVKSEKGYRNLDYLIKKYRISYAYSATLLYEGLNKEPDRSGEGLVAFAPVYHSEGPENTIADASTTNSRSALAALDYNQSEALSIGEILDGKPFVGPEALEAQFKSSAVSSSIIHLAMHALTDDKDPMNSKLVFTQSNDSTQDGFLHAFELYDMEIPAELAVLSACETGYGKLSRGEGIMSLARAFSYAGCKSVVMSHWLTNDNSASELMMLFYQNLAEGKDKDEALRNAKLSFLENADNLQSHPYFWGQFVATGDMRPLKSKGLKIEFVVFIFSLPLFLFFWFFQRRKKTKVTESE